MNNDMHTGSPGYAGFFSRASASACDIFILMVGIGLAQRSTPYFVHGIANITITFAYYAILLSLHSKTLGQLAFRQIVLTQEYNRLSISLAIKRAAWILVSYLLLGLPFLTILFTKKRQALHDIMTDTIVIASR
jgi:uncharacterized RDD family membrane protein YckC